MKLAGRFALGVLRFVLSIPVTILEAMGPPAKSGHAPPPPDPPGYRPRPPRKPPASR